MNQEERQLLQGLFDRLRDNSNQQRDPEVERFIADQIRMQPGAPYYMSQAVIVQEQALQQAQERIAELEDRLRQAETGGQSRSQSSFLAGRTGGMFGRGSAEPQRATSSVPATGPWNRGPAMAPQQPSPQQGYAQPMQAQQQPAAASGGFGGGGFLKGAIATAAGVAGGALIYDQMKGMFGGGSGAAQASSANADNSEANRYQDAGQDQAEDANDDSSTDQAMDSGDTGDTEI